MRSNHRIPRRWRVVPHCRQAETVRGLSRIGWVVALVAIIGIAGGCSSPRNPPTGASGIAPGPVSGPGTPPASSTQTTSQPTSVGQPVSGLYNLEGSSAAETGYTVSLTIAPQQSLGSSFLLIEVIAVGTDGKPAPVEELAATATAGTMNVTSDTYRDQASGNGAPFVADYTTNPATITFASGRCSTVWATYAGTGSGCTFAFAHN